MEVNPYQPPVVAAPTLADEQNGIDRPVPRPIGIWILAGLHLLAGVLFLAALAFARFDAPASVAWFFVAIFAVFAVLALATSLGMWLGARWAWWLTAFYYMWGALGSGAHILPVLWGIGELDVEFNWRLVLNKLFQSGIHVLILLYLFKGTVRDFFRLKSLRMASALLPLAAIAIVVVAATFAVTYFHAPVEP